MRKFLLLLLAVLTVSVSATRVRPSPYYSQRHGKSRKKPEPMGYTFLKSREPYYEDPFDLGRRNRASVSYLVKQNRNLLERLCEAEEKIEAFTKKIDEKVEQLEDKI